jgi:hypothetical protein
MGSPKVGEKSIPPPTYEGWYTSPPTYENEFFYPLNFLKLDKSPPKAVFKKHNKSRKNHKMKNQIALNFKLVVICSEHTI